MKAHRLSLAAFAVVALAAVLSLAVPEAFAAVTSTPFPHLEVAQLATALAVLRTQHADLTTRIAATQASIVDGMAEEEVRRIEGEHAALVAQAETLQRQIDEAVRAEQATTTTTTTTATPDAIRAERQRVATINEIGRRAALTADVIRAAVEGDTTVEAFRAQAFDALATRQAAAPTSSVTITRDERDTMRRGMTDAIVARLARAAGERNVQIPEHARAYSEMGFAEMAAEAIGHRGHLRTARQVGEVLERAFHSTSDFPGIFTDAMNVRLLGRYQLATPAYRLFAARYNANDFRQQNIVRAGDFPTLQPVGETGEIKAGTFSESKEVMTVSPYAVRFGISRQMIVNDNLGAIDQVIGSSSDRVVDWENAKAFALLISASHAGPTLLTDNKAVFHTGHSNHVTSGTAISVTSVGLGRSAMMAQTSLDGLKLNLRPAVILTGADRATEAEQLTTQITPATMGAVVPDWMKRLQAAADANIDGNHWYLFADPSVCPCFVYGNLNGYEGPRLSTNDPFTVQGIEVKLEHDFGIAGIDYRGAYHNAGAAPT